MRVGTASESREIDKICINDLKIPSIILMENAALKVLENIDLMKFDSFIIICGKGNNGGDGLAIARKLYLENKKIQVFLLKPNGNLSCDCEINYNILENMGIKINVLCSSDNLENLETSIKKSDMVIDCIFGTGLSRDVEGIYKDIISMINKNSNYTLSVDVPSGINSDTGEILSVAVKANKTISFVNYKKGFIKYSCSKFTGDIKVENIGVPQLAINKACSDTFILDKKSISKNILKRNKFCNKGNFGRAVLIAGSCGFTGAAYISTQSAVKSGAGLVTLISHKDVQNILSSKFIEAMTVNFDDELKFNNCLNKANSIAIGPGMGNNKFTYEIVEKVLRKTNCPIVLDADAINVLKDNIDILKNANNKIIITPHPGEMSRITGLDIDYINNNRIDVAKNFASKYGVIVLLKGYNTVITDGKKTYINSTGNSAMANGGMGDCLTGIIVSFLAQGYDPIKATYISTFIHGYCGDKLSEKMFCVNAEDIIKYLPFAIKEIMS